MYSQFCFFSSLIIHQFNSYCVLLLLQLHLFLLPLVLCLHFHTTASTSTNYIYFNYKRAVHGHQLLSNMSREFTIFCSYIMGWNPLSYLVFCPWTKSGLPLTGSTDLYMSWYLWASTRYRSICPGLIRLLLCTSLQPCRIKKLSWYNWLNIE